MGKKRECKVCRGECKLSGVTCTCKIVSTHRDQDYDPIRDIDENEHLLRRLKSGCEWIRAERDKSFRLECIKQFGDWLNSSEGIECLNHLKRLADHYAADFVNPADDGGNKLDVHQGSHGKGASK